MQRPIADQPGDAELRRLLDAAAEGLALVRAGRLAWANAALAQLAGVPDPKELIGLALEDLFADASHGLPGGDTPGPPRCRLLARPGQEPRAVLVEPIPESVAGALRVRDATDGRTLGPEVLSTRSRLQEAHRELVALRERLRIERAEREEILNVVSHELRTPITVIAGFNRLLLSESAGPLTDRQRHFLEESQKSCHRLNHFVANLLEAGRQTACVGPLEVTAAPIRASIDAALALLAPLLREAGVAARVEVDPATPRARFDPPRIEQVLTNLIGNAIRYAPAGSAVAIDVRAGTLGERACVRVAVCDEGPGIPPSDRARIFEPYVQVESRRSGGLGLGLAICRRIVEAHGGAIHVEENPGGGSRFVFHLPAAENP